MLMIDPVLVSTGVPPTRASTATYHDAYGVLRTAAIDEVRPIVEVLGSTNLITQSNSFTAGTAETDVILSTTVKGPDASTFAYRVEANTGFAKAYATSPTVSTGMTKGAIYGASVYVQRSAAIQYASLRLDTSSGGAVWMFADLLAGSLISVSTDDGKTKVLNTSVELLADNWVRLGMTLTYPSASGTSATLRAQLSDISTSPTSSVMLGASIHAFGWQLEAGPVSSYIPTSGATASRAPDVLAAAVDGVSELIASNVPLGDYAAWDIATAYTTGQRVVASVGGYFHDVYEAVAASTGVNPVGDLTGKWLLVGKVNRWRMFDGYMSTSTSVTSGDINVTIRTGGPVDSLVMWVSAAKVLVSVVDDVDGLIYNKTVSLRNHVADSSWHSYFFTPQTSTDLLVLTDLPLSRRCLVNIQVLNSGTTEVGQCLVGRQYNIGDALWGVRTGINDYSDVSRDTWGNAVITERADTNRCEFGIVLDTPDVGRIKELLRSKKTKPCVYIGSVNHRTTVVYGYYKALDLVLSNFVKSDYNLEVEELT